MAARPGHPAPLIDDIEAVGFPLALRGYDREAVDEFLAGIVARLRASEPSRALAPDVRRQLDRFGERAEEILSAADEVAAELRSEAESEAAEAREAAAEEARRVVLEAGAKAEEILVEADRRAERIIAEGSRRRLRIEAETEELAERRDQIAAELRRISQELRLSVVENTRVAPVDGEADADQLDPEFSDEPEAGVYSDELDVEAPTGRFQARALRDTAER